LIAEYAGASVSLMLYLAACFVDACQDMPAAIVGDLYGRFLALAAYLRHLSGEVNSDGR
jgi:hypothetical protein